jgi:hypothetical protein
MVGEGQAGAHWSDLIGAVIRIFAVVGSLGEGEVMGSSRGRCKHSTQDVELQDDPRRLLSQPNGLGSTRNQNQKKALVEFYNLRYSCIYLSWVAGCASSCEVLEAV